MQNLLIHKFTGKIHIPRSFWYSATFVIIYLAFMGSLFISGQSSSSSLLNLPKLLNLVSLVLSFGLSWVGFKPSYWKRELSISERPSAEHRLRTWVPLIFSMALAFQCIGGNIYGYYGLHHLFTFPSWGDAFILGSYPLLMLGMLCFPIQSLSGKTRISILLNSSLIIVALMTFSWYFLLGPLLLRNVGDSSLVVLTHLAFPAFDLLLICYIVLFIAIVPRGHLRLTGSILSIALVLFVLADSISQYQSLHGIQVPGWYLIGWGAGNFLIALAVQSMRWVPTLTTTESAAHESSSGTKVSVWQSLLPYSLVPAVFGLAFYIWGIDRSSPLAIGTYTCSVLLLALIFAKQVVAIHESYWLNHKLQVANGRLESLATTDPLTKLPNHRSLMLTLTNELERAERYQRSCVLLFFDLDHFKALNDGYGHMAGDEVLAAFGQRLSQNVRKVDIVGRWGGEEFVAILPETTVEEADKPAERVRSIVSQQPFDIGGGIFLTCSIGIACYPTHATTLNDLVNAADQAMYAAKRLGRNQLRCIDDPAVQRVLESKNNQGGREEAALQGTIDALVSLMEQHDAALGAHTETVAELVKQIAVHLDVPLQEAHMMQLAGKLYDIGKISIPDTILQKPGPLTSEEWALMKKHPQIGAEIVAYVPTLRPLDPVIRAHHERWDGTGYPNQLSGEDIPLASRIIAVADAYSAMIVSRPYQQAQSSTDALKELRRCAGTQFDPAIVEVLATLLTEQSLLPKIVVAVG